MKPITPAEKHVRIVIRPAWALLVAPIVLVVVVADRDDEFNRVYIFLPH
jgi:hypothetical protein